MPEPLIDRQALSKLSAYLPNKKFVYTLLSVWIGAVMALLGCGVYLRDPVLRNTALDLLRYGFLALAMVAVLLLFITIGVLLIDSIDRDGAPSFERQWGSLGQSLQGWSLSRSLTFFLLFLFVGGLFALLAAQALNPSQPPATSPAPATNAPTAQKPPEAIPEKTGAPATNPPAGSATGPTPGHSTAGSEQPHGPPATNGAGNTAKP